MATKRSGTTTKGAGRKAAAKKIASVRSMPKSGKNPEGGLTAKGREYFAKKEGSQLRPGVTGAADTPEKMRRKGSFLTRMFSHPRGPMVDAKGEPTRLALSAHAWGEPVPKNDAAARKLAQKGRKLLEHYHAQPGKKAAKKVAVRKSAAKKTTAQKVSGKKSS